MYCNLIVTRPFNQVFTYDIGNAEVKKGQIAIVSFGKSLEVGMIVEIKVSKPNYNIKKVIPIEIQNSKVSLIQYDKNRDGKLLFINK